MYEILENIGALTIIISLFCAFIYMVYCLSNLIIAILVAVFFISIFIVLIFGDDGLKGWSGL